MQADPGWDLSDATRAPLRNAQTLVQTDGQPDGSVQFLTAFRNEVNWIKVKVDPRSRDVFSFGAMEVPGNRVAVPAP